MYKAYLKETDDSRDKKTIHEPLNYGNKLSSGELKVSLEGLGISTFECSLSIANSLYGKTKPITNMICVLDSNGEKVFHGRIAKITKSMTSSGEFSEKILCEDRKSYLYDSTQKYLKPTIMSVREYLQRLLDEHNRQVEPFKQMRLGNVTVGDSEQIYRGIGYYKTAELIKDRLLDRLGGYLVLREDTQGSLILDYLKDYGEVSRTPLQITRNLRSATRDIDISELATRIVPLGQEIETSETVEIGTDFSRPKHTIADVNGGVDYLQDFELIAEFGIIQKNVDFQNVTDHNVLKRRGEEYLKNQRAMLVSWTVEVIELGLIDSRYELIQVGNSYPIENPMLYGAETLQVTEKTVNILEPQRIVLTIGSSKKTLSSFQQSYSNLQYTLSDTLSSVNFQIKSTNEVSQKLEGTNVTLTETVGELENTKILAEGNQTKIESVKIETSTIKENLDETIRINDERSKLLLQQIEDLKNQINNLK